MPTADQLLAVVWRRRLAFLVTVACGVAAVAAVTYSLPKTYSTSAYLVVSTLKPTSSDFAAQQVSQVDTQTAAELMQSRNTADLVASQLPYRASPTEVQGRVSIAPIAQTQLVLITASESTPARAQQLANTFANVFTRGAAPTISFARVGVSEPAPLITTASGPRVHLYLLVGVLLALLAGAGAALAHERFDRRLRIDDEATELLGLPILARVPALPTRRLGGRRVDSPYHDTRFLEGFQWVLANLAFVNGGDRPRIIAVVSAGEQEGKSTVCIALANAAEEILRGGVLLVDTDLRRPTLASRLSASGSSPGFSSYLAEPGFGDDAVRALTNSVPDSAIDLIPSGTPPANPAGLLGLPVLDQLIESVRRMYEFVIFDTPPLRVGADASVVAARTDGAVLVLDAHRTQRQSVEWSLGQLRRAGVNVLGVVVNRASDTADLGYYHRDSQGGRGAFGRRARTSTDVPRRNGGDGGGVRPEPPVVAE